MKKLMIAAAAAAMVGGAFAGDFAGLYNLKFTLKTLAPKTISCSKSDCNICKTVPADDRHYYENGTVKLEGIIAYCSTCEFISAQGLSVAALALWDPTNKEPVYFDDAWKTNSSVITLLEQVDVAASNVFSMIDTTVYGKSSTKVGMDFVMSHKDEVRGGDWDLRAAGLGTWCWVDDENYDKGNKLLGYVKSVSGNVAGRIPYKTGYTGTKGAGSYMGGFVVASECLGAADYCSNNPNAELPVCGENPSVPAYGTWSIKRNASATEKPLYKSIPSYL